MQTKVVTHFEPSSLAPPSHDVDLPEKARKQREVMNRVLADSLVHQLEQRVVEIRCIRRERPTISP